MRYVKIVSNENCRGEQDVQLLFKQFFAISTKFLQAENVRFELSRQQRIRCIEYLKN